jgi:uncharacterized HAD superfamily protein
LSQKIWKQTVIASDIKEVLQDKKKETNLGIQYILDNDLREIYKNELAKKKKKEG